MNPRFRIVLPVLAAVIAAGVAVVGAFNSLECARTVDVVASLAGAFGAGAALVAAIRGRGGWR